MTGDDSISNNDQMVIVDNKPINNVYYQLKRLPRPQMIFWPRAGSLPVVSRTVARSAPGTIIKPVPVEPVQDEVVLKRRGNFPECSLPPDAGDCTGEFVRIFFDDRKMSCEVFYYSGCGGNGNRFTSIKACYDICSPHTTTVKGPEVLSGKRYVIMSKSGEVEPPSMHPPFSPFFHISPFSHFHREISDREKVHHPDSQSEKVPVSNSSGSGYEQMNEQIQSEVKPTKVKGYRYSSRGMGFPNPGMMTMMFPDRMGMPANF